MLATNYWKCSDASTLISNSIRELSKRAGERGSKVIVKIMYDRGNPKQVGFLGVISHVSELRVLGLRQPSAGVRGRMDRQGKTWILIFVQALSTAGYRAPGPW